MISTYITSLGEIIFEKLEALEITKQEVKWRRFCLLLLISILECYDCIVLRIKHLGHLLTLLFVLLLFEKSVESLALCDMEHYQACKHIRWLCRESFNEY